MVVEEILNEKKEQKGTYAGVRFSTETKKALHLFIKDASLPNSIRPDKMHTTLLYSRKYLPEYEAQGEIDPPWVGTPSGFDVWMTNGENSPKSRCLVLEYKCPELTARHKELMKEHGATFDYPEYKTHITLSYDIEDMEVSNLPRIEEYITEIEIVEEYQEDLDLNWAKNKGVKKG